jgi:hypothetical protein
MILLTESPSPKPRRLASGSPGVVPDVRAEVNVSGMLLKHAPPSARSLTQQSIAAARCAKMICAPFRTRRRDRFLRGCIVGLSIGRSR